MRPRPKVLSSRSMLRLVSEPPASRRLAAMEDPIFALVIQKSSPDNATLGFSASEQRRWLEHAARHDLCLMVLSTPDALELYSTAKHRTLAFRPALSQLQTRVALHPESAKTPTRQLSGPVAAQRLLERAAGLHAHAGDWREGASLIRDAAARSAAYDTLGSTLGSLCWAAASVAERTQQEAAGDDEFEIQRIIGEELERWRAELAELRRSLRPPPPPTERVLAPYQPEEPGSLIRIKVPQDLVRSG